MGCHGELGLTCVVHAELHITKLIQCLYKVLLKTLYSDIHSLHL